MTNQNISTNQSIWFKYTFIYINKFLDIFQYQFHQFFAKKCYIFTVDLYFWAMSSVRLSKDIFGHNNWAESSDMLVHCLGEGHLSQRWRRWDPMGPKIMLSKKIHQSKSRDRYQLGLLTKLNNLFFLLKQKILLPSDIGSILKNEAS